MPMQYTHDNVLIAVRTIKVHGRHGFLMHICFGKFKIYVCVCVYLFLGKSVTISISRSVIVRQHASLRKYINLESLIPHLNAYEILTKGERDQLSMPEISSHQKIDRLLQFLESKSDESIQNFLKALKDADEHTGHRKLLDILNQA